jgi:exopolyphosphatase/guanosine-5'-triphosphate,3'-diphosphate pyrophosphatase
VRLAIIDLGTNSVRFDIHQVNPQGKHRELHREKLMVRLGQGLFTQGTLATSAIERTLEAFKSFQQSIQRYHASHVVAFGTSALRDATDGETLLRKIEDSTGIQIRVISGQEEARLIAQGILANEKPKKLPKQGRTAFIDIGGGSTEITVVERKSPIHSDSFALGTARLQQLFLQKRKSHDSDPISKLRLHIRSTLLPKLIGEEWGKSRLVVGSSGTIRTLHRMARKQSRQRSERVSLSALSQLVQRMSNMDTLEILEIPGMDPKRIDMILGGAILFEECMKALGAKEFQTTEYTLRDGILVEELNVLKTQTRSSLELHLDEIREKAIKAGAQKAHFEHVQKNSRILFEKLQRLHGLDSRFKSHLEAAAILHDVGEMISPSRHEEHSYYFVKNADFIGLQPWEVDLIAELCRRHRGNDLVSKPQRKKNRSKKSSSALQKVELATQSHEAFPVLLGILRLADALDRSHQGKAEVESVRTQATQIFITLKSTGNLDLELLRVEQKKAAFEAALKRKLRILI